MRDSGKADAQRNGGGGRCRITLRDGKRGGALALILALCAAGTPAATDPGEPAAPAAARPAQPDDGLHPVQWLSARVTGAGDRLDTFLANRFRAKNARPDEPFAHSIGDPQEEEEDEEEVNRTYIRVSPGFEYLDGEGVTSFVRASLRLALPRTAERVQLVFDSFDDDHDVVDSTLQRPALTDASSEDGGQTLSLRLSLHKTLHTRATFDTGLRFQPEPDPRLRFRYRMWTQAGPVIVRGVQSIFWEPEDGFGEKTQLDIEHGQATQRLVRASTSVLWSETSEGVQGGEVLSYSHTLGHRNAIGLSLGASFPLEPPVAVEKYTAQLPYRHRLHGHWLFMELTPGVDFPRARDFKVTPFIMLKFSLIFGYTRTDS